VPRLIDIIRNPSRGFRRFLAFTAILALGSAAALACNVPVFRYALEHWRPDQYRAVVFHRGELTAEDQERVAQLEQQAESTRVNIRLRTVDIDAMKDPTDRELFADSQDAELPRLVLQYPAYLRLDHAVWSGPVTEESVAALVDSSARREMLKRLVEGQTGVWILLETGDAVQDEPAFRLLSSELKQLQLSLKLPKLTDSPEDILLGGPDLRVAFSTLRIRRDDPLEQPLVAMLLAAEDDLNETREPMVFPVFGRGRVMLPLVGAGISEDNIRTSASFLVGACSCQVKELNPGFDLLVSADWKELIPWATSPAFAPGNPTDGEPELVAIPSGSKAAPAVDSLPPFADAAASPASNESPASTPANRLPIMLGAAVLVGLALAALLRRQPS
jgi:hypothetical protein